VNLTEKIHFNNIRGDITGETLFYHLNGLMSFGSAKGLVRDFSS
ncbi:uncharacterized protein METZ01_LOCUS372728, partial [marine metagenome]